MEWGSPKNFIWLWALALVTVCFWASSWFRKSQLKRFGDVALVDKLLSSLDPRKRLFKRILLVLSVLFMVLALCQPHFRRKETQVERRGIDVIIAIDVSQSMMARDVSPSRLERAKLELAGLVDKLKRDRIGIVAFAGEAFIQCPLTLDKNAAKLFLSTVNPNLIPTPGTAISKAVRVATQAFSQKEKEFKALILLTDGEDHHGNPSEEVQKAKEGGVRIFTIGIGTPSGSTIPLESGQSGYKKDRKGEPVFSKLNEPLLQEIARQTGGVYTRSTKGEIETQAIAREIASMAQKGLKKEWSVEYEENYQYFLLPALFLLFAEMALSERKSSWRD